MSLKSRFLRGGMQLSAGNAGQQALVFLRNVLIARILGPDQFGIAITLIILTSALEVVTDLGVEKYIIRTDEAQESKLQPTLHTILILRGLVLGLIVFVTAGFAAQSFGVPEAAPIYQAMALLPIIKGFKHLDMQRFHRELNYLPDISTSLIGSISGLLIAVSLGLAWQSFEAMLWVFLGESVVIVTMSHILAQRPYRLGLDEVHLKALFGYGWPLMMNGVIIFLMSQGDRIVVGSQLGVRELAYYAVASILTVGPTTIVMRVSGALFLPLLSDANIDAIEKIRRYEISVAFTFVFSLVITLAFIFYGIPLAELVYGSEYEVPLIVMASLAVAAGAKTMRAWAVTRALASGNTGQILVANILRVSGFAGAVVSLQNGYGASGVAAFVALGELLAMIYALERSDKDMERQSLAGRKLSFLYTGIVSVGVIVVLYNTPSWINPINILANCSLLTLAGIALLFLLPGFRSFLKNQIEQSIVWNKSRTRTK